MPLDAPFIFKKIIIFSFSSVYIRMKTRKVPYTLVKMRCQEKFEGHHSFLEV